MRYMIGLLIALVALPLVAHTSEPGPWTKSDAIIAAEPFSGNTFEFDQAFRDPKLKAILLKAGQGDRDDGALLYVRAAEARRRNIPLGLYFWGVSTTPWTSTKKKGGKTIVVHHSGVAVRDQVRRFLTVAHEVAPRMMALDLEGVNDGFHDAGIISLEDAALFIKLLRNCTDRDPVLYSNQSTMKAVAAKYDGRSAFAGTALWLAGRKITFTPNRLWTDYTLWQFGAEWDCNPYRPKSEWDKVDYKTCDPHARYPVLGSHYDLDIDLFRGDDDRFRAVFGSPLRPDPTCADQG